MRFQIPESSKQSLEGHLLAAAPAMADPRFRYSVVLILHDSPQGTLGIVLNQRIVEPAQDVEETFKSWLEQGSALFQGGPVAGSLIMLQVAKVNDQGAPAAGSIVVVHEQDQLKKLAGQANGMTRLFLGHTGWQAGKLQEELRDGAWHLLDPHPEFLLQEGQQMWVAAIREVGREFYRSVLHIDPSATDVFAN